MGRKNELFDYSCYSDVDLNNHVCVACVNAEVV